MSNVLPEPFSDAKRISNTLRLIWALMLLSLLFATGAIYGLVNAGQISNIQQTEITPYATNLSITSWCLVLFSFVFGHIMRMQTYKKNWVAHSITPPGYFKGMGLFLGLNYFCNFCNLIILICLSYSLFNALPFFLGCLILIFNFPNNKPLKKHA